MKTHKFSCLSGFRACFLPCLVVAACTCQSLAGEPLHEAVSFRVRIEMVKLLLDAGADKTALDKYNRTPLDYVRKRNEEVYPFMVNYP